MLTEKSEQEFNKWLYSVYFKEYYNYQMIWQLMGETARNAVIIEWLHTKQYKGQTLFDYLFRAYYDHKIRSQTHFDVLKQVIEEANEIFNNT